MSLLTREPVRAAFITTVTAVLALLVALDVIDDAASAGIGGAVLALVGLVTELTRARVVPLAKFSPPVFADPEEGAGELRLILCVVAGCLLAYFLVAVL